MDLGSLELQIFVSLTVVLGGALVALICDYLKGNNEQLREHNIELRVRKEEQERRMLLDPAVYLNQISPEVSNSARPPAKMSAGEYYEDEETQPAPERRAARPRGGRRGRNGRASSENFSEWVRPEVFARVARQAESDITSSQSSRDEMEVPRREPQLQPLNAADRWDIRDQLPGRGRAVKPARTAAPSQPVAEAPKRVEEVEQVAQGTAQSQAQEVILRPLTVPTLKLEEEIQRVAEAVAPPPVPVPVSWSSPLLEEVIAASAERVAERPLPVTEEPVPAVAGAVLRPCYDIAAREHPGVMTAELAGLDYLRESTAIELPVAQLRLTEEPALAVAALMEPEDELPVLVAPVEAEGPAVEVAGVWEPEKVLPMPLAAVEAEGPAAAVVARVPETELPMPLAPVDTEGPAVEVAGVWEPEKVLPMPLAPVEAEGPAAAVVARIPERELPMPLAAVDAEGPALEVADVWVPERELPVRLASVEAEGPAVAVVARVPETELPMPLASVDTEGPAVVAVAARAPEDELPVLVAPVGAEGPAVVAVAAREPEDELPVLVAPVGAEGPAVVAVAAREPEDELPVLVAPVAAAMDPEEELPTLLPAVEPEQPPVAAVAVKKLGDELPVQLTAVEAEKPVAEPLDLPELVALEEVQADPPPVWLPPVMSAVPAAEALAVIEEVKEPVVEQDPDLILPAGMQELSTWNRLLEMPNPVSGYVVMVRVEATENRNAPSTENIPELIDNLVRSLLREGDFGCQIGESEWVLIYPHDMTGLNQRRVGMVPEKLWDFKLRNINLTHLTFKWGAVDVKSERLLASIDAARSRLYATRRNRILPGAHGAGPRWVVNG